MYYAMIAVAAYVTMLLHSHFCKGGIDCLSDMAYDRHRWVFPALMSVIAMCLFESVLQIDESVAWIAFVGCVAMVGIGVTPYKDDFSAAHRVFAVVAMLSVVGLYAARGDVYVPLFFVLASLRKRWLLGIEMGMMAAALYYCFPPLNH